MKAMIKTKLLDFQWVTIFSSVACDSEHYSCDSKHYVGYSRVRPPVENDEMSRRGTGVEGGEGLVEVQKENGDSGVF
jgi:hypothetical protein